MGSSEPQTWNVSLRASHGRPSPVSHIPEKSTLPSGVRGVAAVRLGFPSAVRGTPAVGCVSHWPATGDDAHRNTPAATEATSADEVKRGGMVCSRIQHAFYLARPL